MSDFDLQIVPMQVGDVSAVLTIQSQCGFDTWGADWYQEKIGSGDVLFRCAKKAENILGFIVAQRLADEMEIYLVAVATEHRCQKIGFLLVACALEWARQEKCSRVFLEVRATNIAAHNLYRSFGFVIEGTRKNYYHSPVEDAWLLGLAL